MGGVARAGYGIEVAETILPRGEQYKSRYGRSQEEMARRAHASSALAAYTIDDDGNVVLKSEVEAQTVREHELELELMPTPLKLAVPVRGVASVAKVKTADPILADILKGPTTSMSI